jgi:hypothetical protein
LHLLLLQMVTNIFNQQRGDRTMKLCYAALQNVMFDCLRSAVRFGSDRYFGVTVPTAGHAPQTSDTMTPVVQRSDAWSSRQFAGLPQGKIPSPRQQERGFDPS